MKYSVRLAEVETEQCIEGTMVVLTLREVILKESKTFSVNKNWVAKTEDLMSEILTHEILHLVLLDLLDEVTSTALDNICGWDSYSPVIEFGKLRKIK